MSNHETPARASLTRGRRRLLLVAVAMTILVTMAISFGLRSKTSQFEQLMKSADAEFRQGRCEEAEEKALQALDLLPSRGDAALLAAECATLAGNPIRAIRHLQRVRPDDSRWYITAALRTADIYHFKLCQLREAEQVYRDILDADPDHAKANEGLARLLSVCGRREEAIPCVIRLIRAGVETDLVILLARESGAVDDRQLLSRAAVADSQDANPLIGQAWAAISENRHQDARRLLEQAVACPGCPSVAWGMLGGQLVTTESWDILPGFETGLPEAARDLADVWRVRALTSTRADDRNGAIRAWQEVLMRRPESRQAASQLAQQLASAGRSAEATACAEWAKQLQQLSQAQHRALFSDDTHHYEDLVQLVQTYYQVGRWWEADAWGRVALQMEAGDARIADLLRSIQQEAPRMPLRITRPEFIPKFDIGLTELPARNVISGTRAMVQPSSAVDLPVAAAAFSFHEEAGAKGLEFEFFNGTDGMPTHRMFEFTGGGIAVLDLDRDDCPDVCLTQGTTWPPLPPSGLVSPLDFEAASAKDRPGDRLFRNRLGQAFDDVSTVSGIHESSFGQGASAGDLNSDGFPDLYVANIGGNTLWINNGDGTFLRQELPTGATSDLWTTSCLIADVDGDALPDLYDVNYVMATDVFVRTCRGPSGQPALCAPQDFESAPDQIWRNNGDGTFENTTRRWGVNDLDGNGLGVLAWNEGSNGRLSLFVANDQSANSLLRPVLQGEGSRLADAAFAAGVAFNGRGETEACMGVAAGDADGDGRIDLFVTNFWHESNTLYCDAGGGAFADQTGSFGLAEPSLNLLGFGAQFLDADLDGQPELFVANGHLEDLKQPDQAYKMPPQLFARGATVFRPVAAPGLGAYFETSWVGRAVARCDWNLDNRDDLIVGHLDAPVALLSNTTASPGASLSIRFCGTTTSRDAPGTSVSVTVNNVTRAVQLMAGDGYQCSNERRLNIGCGDAEVAERVEIRWPSGDSLVAVNVTLNRRYVADQNSDRLFLLPDGIDK